MRFRPGPQRRLTGRAISIWVIALLVAAVATIQIRSEAEVERSLVGIDTTSLAFLIDDLHRANDALLAEQAGGGVAIGGVVVLPPWTITTIGDATRIAEVANLMTQELRADRRVRQASYRVEADIAIQAVISEKPFVYAIS